VRTKDNYTIHHILCDYSIVPFCVPIEGTNIFNNMCLTVPQLLELCYNLKTKRSEMLLEAFANNNFEKHIAENHKKEIEDKKLLTITA
jgi:hypothetical protein